MHYNLSAAMLMVVIFFSRFGTAGDRPGGDKPKPLAAALVEDIIAQENRIDSVRSLYLRFEGKWTRPPEAIARTIAEMRRRRPDEEIKVEANSNLWPEMTEDWEFAFDEKRVRKLTHWHKSHRDLRVFDGRQAVAHSKYFTHSQEHYALDNSTEQFFTDPFIALSALRMGPHRLWFWKDRASPDDRMRINGVPKDYAHAGQEILRGRPCYMLENRVAHRRLQVGVDDGRLYGLTYLRFPEDADPLPFEEKAADRTFASKAELAAWLGELSPEERMKYYDRLHVEQFVLARPWAEHYMDDYRELAPGLWFPATQGYTLYKISSTGSQVDVRRELQLVEAEVDKPLADDLFTIKLEDGIQVYDWRRDPPLSYKQKAERTDEEWQEIIDAERRQNEKWKKEEAARDALVGEPAPKLPESKWLNSEPLTWETLRGKVVLLHFWAHWCGPCHNDLPILTDRHKNAAESNVVIIGVHNPGSELADIEKDIKEYEIGYPILIDVRRAPDQPATWGLLSHQLRINGIPHAVVVDAEGRIAAQGGSIFRMLGRASELTQSER